jgi:glycosyltransferase involved in cell wall biosynthesis
MRVAFVSLIPAPWGGSEELWSRAARVLRGRGATVAVGVRPWPTPVPQIRGLADVGCEIHWHHAPTTTTRLMWRLGRSPDRPLRWLIRFRPDVVVHSVCWQGDNLNVDLFCLAHGLRHIRLVQLAGEAWWPGADVLDALTLCYTGAVACCFVSRANRRLVETQLGTELPNARVVWNPSTIPPESLPWPDEGGGFRVACVGRLLQALAAPRWRERRLSVSVYGSGPGEPSLRRLAGTLGLADPFLRFPGFCPDIRAVWAGHHALVLPSRQEGMPLAAIEAMMCGRVPILTAVAGNQELVADRSGIHPARDRRARAGLGAPGRVADDRGKGGPVHAGPPPRGSGGRVRRPRHRPSPRPGGMSLLPAVSRARSGSPRGGRRAGP